MTLRFHMTIYRDLSHFYKSRSFHGIVQFMISCDLAVQYLSYETFYDRSDIWLYTRFYARKHYWGEVTFIRPLNPKFHVAYRILIACSIRSCFTSAAAQILTAQLSIWTRVANLLPPNDCNKSQITDTRIENMKQFIFYPLIRTIKNYSNFNCNITVLHI